MKNQPNLFLIGGMRCGSTALNQLLNQHGDIFMTPIKEPYFYSAELKRFNLNINYSKEGELNLNDYVKKGKYRTRDAYISLFEKSENYKYRGESSHYIYHKDVASIIKMDSSESKIIISVRNPIDRLYSEYLYHSRNNQEHTYDFTSYVKDNLKLYSESKPTRIVKGIYSDSVSHWVNEFGKENVKVIIYEEFNENQQRVLDHIYNWLNLSSSIIRNVTPQKTGQIKFKALFYLLNSSTFFKNILKRFFSKNNRIKIRSIFYTIFLKRKKTSDITSATRNQLINFYKEDVFRLGNLLNKDLSFWLKA